MTPLQGRKTVVSVTPIAIERDSRTLKQAASLARAGYRSIAVEGERSRLELGELPFELLTPVRVPDAWGSKPRQNGDGEGGFESEEARVAALLAREGPVKRKLRILHDLWFQGLERHLPRLLVKWRRFKWHLRWTLSIRRTLPRADLYIVHAPHAYPPVALRRLRAPRARYAYDAHDAYFETERLADEEQDETTPPPRHPTWERLERRCVKGARYFVTVSDAVADLLEERFGRRPAVVRNCGDLRLDRSAATGLRDRLGLSGGEFLLVFVGNHKPGISEAGLEALRRLPADVHLAFVGRGHEALREQIAEMGLEDRVHPIGPVPSAEVTSFISSADAAAILYYPLTRSYERSLPNGFFHGLAAGLPTLYPESLPEVAALTERYGLGLPMDTRDPDSIAAAVHRIRDDPELARRLRAGAERAREVESWEQEERRFLSLVESALDLTPRTARYEPKAAR